MFAGVRYGAVVLEDASGNVIATSYLQATGVGPQVNFQPGTKSTVQSSALGYPSNVAVDGSGNIYIADTGNNRILKETLSAGSYTESTVPTSVLNSPSGVAIDGSGNLYVVDSGNNRILKETLSAGSYSESTVPSSALSWPAGVAVDGSGNVYIADTGNNLVLMETLSVGGYIESMVPTSALSWPSGVAVDGSGNVYIVDTGNNRVLMETLSAGSYTESTVPTSALSYPSEVAVDGIGNVYIADTGNNRVMKEALYAGSYTESTVPTSALSYPSGVAVTGSGNVYIADTGNSRVLKENFSDPPSLTFATTAIGSTSNDSPQTVFLGNFGNAALNFPIPSSGNNPGIAANFALSSGASLCPMVSAGSSTAGMLAAGQSCPLFISFMPAATGTLSGTLVLTDNAFNAAAPGSTAYQYILLNGTGTGNTPQSITFAAIPAQAANSTFALTATASSGLLVSFTSTTPVICTVSGSTASLLATGTCTLQANQGGSAVYAAAPAVAQSFPVNLQAQTITFGAIPAQAVNTSVGVTLTATASSGLTVSFTSVTPAICTVSASTATLLALGTCTIQASQAGDGVVYAAAPMVAQSFTVESANPLTAQNFGTVNMGSSSSAIAVPVTFMTSATLGSVSVLTQGATGLDFANAGAGTCATGTSYNAGTSCSTNVKFSPMFAGVRYGAVVLEDVSGNLIGTGYLQGTGVGPQVNFLPNVESKVPTSAMANPSGVAVDGSGNLFIVDSNKNRVLKETLSAGSYTESTVPTSALAYPYGIAIDGSGNLYIADYGNNRILKETLSAGSYTESTVPTSALSFPSDVAVDGSGNLYIADTYNDRILLETLSAGSYTESTMPTSFLNGPSGIALDGIGNLYIADTYNNRVLMETISAGSYTESTLPTSMLNYPGAVRADGNGNLYIADTYNNRVLKETLSAGSYAESIVPTSALNYPSGIVVAGTGNVYIVDTGNNRALKEDFADAPSLSFALTSPGSTSSDSPQLITLENVGNAVLDFPIPSNGSNPSIPTNFILYSNTASACPLVSAGTSTMGTLAAGESCLLPIGFTPTTGGNVSESIVLTDNALNAIAPGYAIQNILLSGAGRGNTQQTITFAAIPTQAANSTLALAATASSGLPITFTSTTPTVCTVSSSTAALLATGTCTLQANQGGSAVYAAAPKVAQSFPVNLLAQTITFGTIPAQAINTSVAVALTGTASSGLPVSFNSTTPSICTVSGSTATLLARGTCTIQANQAGDGVVYAAAPIVTQSFAVESANPRTGTNFGTVNIGSPSAMIAVPVIFITPATLNSEAVLTQGATGLDFTNAGAGSCAAGTSYIAGGSCTVNVTFTPSLAGSRYGAVVLEDGFGNVIATSYLQGIGIGPQVNFLPGTESMVSTSSLYYPQGVAVDGIGNIYIDDAGHNRILKETRSEGGYTESIVRTSTLSSPDGIALDACGSVYIADTGNDRVLKETLSAGSYVESTLPTSALSYPMGITVDGSGNVYVADTGNDRILMESLSAGSYTESTVPTSFLNSPVGVAVDGNGNVYVADTNNLRVLKETVSANSYTESTVLTNFLGSPDEIAVDGSGNLYIAFSSGSSSSDSRILKETLSAGSYTESTVQTSALDGFSGLAVDGRGNFYIADSGNSRLLKEDLADAPILSFALTAPGSASSDSPQTVTLENVGNIGMNFPVPSNGNNPSISATFTLNSSEQSSCLPVTAGSSTAGTLAAGQACLLSVSFTPSTSGNFTGSLALIDNALNAIAPGYAVQNILLDGTGTGSKPQTIAFNVIPAQNLNSTLALMASATSGLPVSFASATPTVCTILGSTASFVAGGRCTIQANQGGNSVYAPASLVAQTFTVNLLDQTITFGVIPAMTINMTAPVMLTATASSNLPVSFTSTTPAICTVSASTAILLALGNCIIQANQSGDGVMFAAAPAVTQSFTVESANPLANTSLGTVNIGSSSSALSIPISFVTSATLGGISVLTQGATGLDFANAGSGSCAVGGNYNAGSSCTVNVTFSPIVAGNRYGAVVLEDGAGNVIATSYLQGIGVGPQVNFLPGTESAVSTSILSQPFGVAMDAGGNLYIADTYNSRVLKETLSAGGYAESIVPTSTLTYPYGIAVDGSGNLYISDTGDNRILKETLSAGSYSESTVLTSALSSPSGVAVDGSGNVYIADSGNNRVLMETLSAGSYVESMVATSVLSYPYGVAVDGSGNIYVSDTYNRRVLKETLSASSYTESTVPTSALGSPDGVTVDGQGNLYISDYFGYGSGNSRVLKETLTAGGYTESTLQTSPLNAPSGLAVAGNGNVYIADFLNNRVLEEDFADAPSLSFAVTAPGSTSSDSPQTVTLENIGNGALDLPIPSSGNNPRISENFVLSSGKLHGCLLVGAGAPAAGTLAAGQACLLSVSFMPLSTGSSSGSLALTDNALNVNAPAYTVQSILLSGTGAGSAQQTITFGAIPAQSLYSTLALTASAGSGLPVSFTSTTPAICTVTGSVASLLTVGICTIQANQTGNGVYAAALAITQSFVVNPQAQTITFSTIPAQVTNTSVAVSLTGTASSGLPVSFTSTTPAICTVSGSTATLLADGVCTIQANQPGDGVGYAAAPTVTQSFMVEYANPLTSASLGTVNIGSSGPAITVPITFSTSGTLGNVSVLTQGATGLDFADAGKGSCAAGTNYDIGAICSVNVTFTPAFAGTRYGAVVLENSSGNVIATGYVQGIGVGPQVNFLPGTESTVPTSTYIRPFGVAVDGSGTLYIADAYNNSVWKETLSADSYAMSTVPTSALSWPSGIAVDGSGEVYIADTYNNRILKETPSAGSYIESTVLTSALRSPAGVAVDGSGNVYIADTGNNRVLMETLSAGSYIETMVPTSANRPSAVAVDGSGNVYIANSSSDRVLMEKLLAGSYTETFVPTSASRPSAVAVDGSGNLFVVDTGSKRILKETLSAGIYVESAIPTGALSYPQGVAIDSGGNVYIADTNDYRVLKEDLRDPPNLSFALTAPGSISSDSPQAVTLENVGNAALSFPIPSSGTNPNIPVNFTMNSGRASSCPLVSTGASIAGMLAPSQSCVLFIGFRPTAGGSLNGTLELTDNALNTIAPVYTRQSIPLSGTGMGNTQQTITFGAIPPQSINSTFVLTASASSGLTVSLTTITPTICTVSGLTARLLAAGTCTIQASQSGSGVYAAATAVAQSFMVNLLAQTISFTAIPAQAANTSVGVALTATASSGLPVSFISTTPAICTAWASTVTLLAPGTCTIQAIQAGDSVVYAAAPMVTQSFIVESANPQTSTSFGTVNIGSAGSVLAVPITFNTAATLGSASVLTQGAAGLDFVNAGTGSCTAGTSYNAGANCSVNVTFTPAFAGTRYGAVVLEDGSGKVIATSFLQGIGMGPQVNFLSQVDESTLPTSTLASPTLVAVDGSGNLYVADTGNNRVLKETLTAGSYSESTVPTSNLSGPKAVAVDGSGNVYIADTGNNRILIETLSAGSYSESTVPTSGLISPEGAAVDGSGNVYIADTGNNRILMEKLSAGSYSESTVPTSSLIGPEGAAVDGSGNVYIADTGNNRILRETLSAGSYTESTVLTNSPAYSSGVTAPAYFSGVTVDGSGNVYVALESGSGANGVLKMTLSAGSYSESTVLPTGALNGPSGVAVDGSGNIYIADSGNNRVLKEDFADPPSLSFAATLPGSTSNDSPRTVVILNVGNAPLNFPVPSNGINPSTPANFTLSNSEVSACPLASAGASLPEMLAAGQSCLLSIGFTPTVGGNLSGSLVLTDNALNAIAPAYTAQSISLSGTGIKLSQAINFTAPATTVGYGVSPIALSATATSGVAVTFSVIGPAVVNGSTLTITGVGAVVVTANQAGNDFYLPAAPVSYTITVNPVVLTVKANSTSRAYGAANSAFTDTITGFVNSDTAATATTGAASLTTIATAASAVGAYIITTAAGTLNAPNYTFTFVNGTLTVNPASLTVTANNASRFYGAANPTFTPSYTGFVNGDTIIALTGSPSLTTTATASTGAGSYAITVAVGTLVPTNYSFTFVNGTLTVNPVLLTVTANNAARIYGVPNPPFTASYSGFVNGDTSAMLSGTPGLTTTATTSSPIGTYSITPAVGTLSAANYTFSYINGSLSVVKNAIAFPGAGDINTIVDVSGIEGYFGDGGLATSGYVNHLLGVSIDTAGNLYIADYQNNRIRKVTATTGGITTVAGNGTGAYLGDGGLAINGELYRPQYATLDSSGNFYIADQWNNCIRKVTVATGIITTVAGNGTQGYSGDGGLAINAELFYPGKVAVDAAGNIYIPDWGNSRVRMVNGVTGIITTFAGTSSYGYAGDGGAATKAVLNHPNAVAFDPSGNLYIADTSNQRVRMVSSQTGIISLVAGNGTIGYSGDGGAATIAKLDLPTDVTFDPSGNLYIEDRYNHAVRRVRISTGDISTVAGTGTAGYSGDGGLATSSELNSPGGVAVDSFGNLYIGDEINNRVRVVAPNGMITPTIAWSTPTAISYGTPLSATQLTASLSVPGSCAYTPVIGTVLGAGAQTLSVTCTPTDTADYSSATATVSLTVNKIPLIVTTDNASRFYGLANPTFTASFTGFVNGDTLTVLSGTPSLTTIATTSSPIGTYTITATVGTLAAANYSFSTVVNGTLTITPATEMITWATPLAITYPTVLSETQLNASLNVPGTCSYTPASGTMLGAGAQTLSVTCTPADRANYFTLTDTVTLTVNPAVLTVTANNAARIYGVPNPPFTASYSGFVNGDTSAVLSGTPSLTTTATTSSPIGTYSITPAVGILSAANYTFSYINGSLSVVKNAIAFPAAGDINTIVDVSGIEGYSGDGGLATSAEVNDPAGVAIDSAGNLYIADYGNNRVRKVTAATGNITTVAGNGTGAYLGDGGLATSAELYRPLYVTLDSSGNLYIADQLNNRIRKVTVATGLITTVAGNGTQGGGGDGGLAINANLYHPGKVAVDAAGNIYIPDWGNSRVRMVNGVTGIITTFAGTSSYGYAGDGGAATKAVLNHPNAVAFDPSGNLYIADTSNQRVRMVSSQTGIISLVAGNGTIGYSGDGGAATIAKLDLPTDVTFDPSGNLYISDESNHAVRRVRIPTGDISTVAGSGTAGYSGDGGLATSSELNNPGGVAVDSFGNLYIGDEINQRVRAVVPSMTTPKITWSTPAAITYGTPLSATQLNASFSVPGTCAYTPVIGTVLGAGAQTLSVTCTPTDTADYNSATATVSLTVNKVALTVTANAASRVYGAANPTFTDTITGFVNGDTAATAATGTASLTTTATASSAVGSYTITAAVGTLAATNYSFSFVNGTLTVTPLGIVATPAFTPTAGTYSSAQTVIVTDTTSGAVIYYTTDGSMPSTSSTMYTAAITVSATETIKAIAVVAGYTNSAVGSATFTVN
jgi:sugar lactone lactonase YvrE